MEPQVVNGPIYRSLSPLTSTGGNVMKRKRFFVEQIVTAVKLHESGTSIANICRKMGIAEDTFYRWKKDYSGLESDQLRELKQLKDENVRLKKLVADLSLDKAMLQDINSRKW